VSRAEGRWEKIFELPHEYKGFFKWNAETVDGITTINISEREL